MEQQLTNAADAGRLEDVEALLRDNPDIDVNWDGSWLARTALHSASHGGHVEVVKLLLAHPAINVNCEDKYGVTPFSLGCLNGQMSIVDLLLKDPRVDVTLADRDECTPLRYASRWGSLEIAERLIASGRDLGDLNKKGRHYQDSKEYSAIEIARKMTEWEVVSLLERFMENPTQTLHELRVKLGGLDALAAELFALTVFLCDDLLQLKPAPVATNPAAVDAAAIHFFSVISKLPMELQMILCHRAVGSMRQNILRQDSESAFKSLASSLLVPSSK